MSISPFSGHRSWASGSRSSGQSHHDSCSPGAVVAVVLNRASKRPYCWENRWYVDTMPARYGVAGRPLAQGSAVAFLRTERLRVPPLTDTTDGSSS